MNNAGQTIANGAAGEGQPGGLEDSSRGLSQATPPDTAPEPSAPRRGDRSRTTPSNAKADLTVRLQELAGLREKYRTGKSGPTVDQVLDELRADRV